MRTSIKRLLISSAAAIAATSIAAVPSAGAGWEQPCEARKLSKAFSQWGDTNDYFLVTGGDFETFSVIAWNLSLGTQPRLGEQSPWKVNSALHRMGLRIPFGGRARTLDICVMVDEETMRFFYRSPGVRGAQLRVDIDAASDMGSAKGSWTADGSVAGWQVSPAIAIPNVRGEDGRQEIEITFTPAGVRATWAIDDVMIDPWRTR
jgi:hypothetical protein